MGWFLEHAYVIPLIPAASFFLILFFGKRMPKKGAEIGIAALGVAFAMALATNVQWRDHVDDAEHAQESHAEEGDHAEEPAGDEGEHAEAAVGGEGEHAEAAVGGEDEHAEEGGHTE